MLPLMGTHGDKADIPTRVMEEHIRAPHPGMNPEALRAHLIIHEMVEKQLVERDPPEVAEALHRLLAGGLSRHEAVHAIGTIVAREAMNMMREGRELNHPRYLRELAGLTVESYRDALGRSRP